MKNMIGFSCEGEETIAPQIKSEQKETERPVRSLVKVRFPELNRCCAYYNDQFDLKEGDMVFVSGKLACECGIVDTVNDKFKINLRDYERVIAHPEVQIHGTYLPLLDKMVSYDKEAVSPDTFRTWVRAPVLDENEKPEYVLGGGYSFDLEHFTEDDDVDHVILQRALDYCNQGKVQYLSIRNGVGTAFVEGTKWYEINFRYENGFVSEMYCECPYSGLCKHNLAVLITLNELIKNTERIDFTALSRSIFIRALTISGQAISL